MFQMSIPAPVLEGICSLKNLMAIVVIVNFEPEKQGGHQVWHYNWRIKVH